MPCASVVATAFDFHVGGTHRNPHHVDVRASSVPSEEFRVREHTGRECNLELKVSCNQLLRVHLLLVLYTYRSASAGTDSWPTTVFQC